MIFVDDAGGYLQGHVDHSPWDDITFADFVMPFFLFMVGTSMSMSFRRYKSGLLKKVLMRTVKLFLLGLATQGVVYGAGFPNIGFVGFNFQNIRIPGILQRIAWAYLCVSLMAMYLPQFKIDRFVHYHIDILSRL
jgi:heparan-alpha-glucosaminide N-acetyltransferase